MIAIGTMVMALATTFSVWETRKLAGLNVQPLLKLTLPTSSPPPASTEGTHGTTYVYLENIGIGVAKNIGMHLNEIKPPSDADLSEFAFSRNTEYEYLGNIQHAQKDFISPVKSTGITTSHIL